MPNVATEAAGRVVTDYGLVGFLIVAVLIVTAAACWVVYITINKLWATIETQRADFLAALGKQEAAFDRLLADIRRENTDEARENRELTQQLFSRLATMKLEGGQ